MVVPPNPDTGIRPMNPVYVALDTIDLDYALGLAERLRGSVGGLKLGLEIFSAHGPEGVRAFAKLGLPLFLALKHHHTHMPVAVAWRVVAPPGATNINVQADIGA